MARRKALAAVDPTKEVEPCEGLATVTMAMCPVCSSALTIEVVAGEDDFRFICAGCDETLEAVVMPDRAGTPAVFLNKNWVAHWARVAK
jgi:hypothetical protein